jgi:hypothetical protein
MLAAASSMELPGPGSTSCSSHFLLLPLTALRQRMPLWVLYCFVASCAGHAYHVVEYAPIPEASSSSSDSAFLLRFLKSHGQSANPLGCFKYSTTAAATTSDNLLSQVDPTTKPHSENSASMQDARMSEVLPQPPQISTATVEGPADTGNLGNHEQHDASSYSYSRVQIAAEPLLLLPENGAQQPSRSLLQQSPSPSRSPSPPQSLNASPSGDNSSPTPSSPSP